MTGVCFVMPRVCETRLMRSISKNPDRLPGALSLMIGPYIELCIQPSCQFDVWVASLPEKDSLEGSAASIESLSDDINMALPISGWRITDLALKPIQLLQLE